jgi:hypothetical protein
MLFENFLTNETVHSGAELIRESFRTHSIKNNILAIIIIRHLYVKWHANFVPGKGFLRELTDIRSDNIVLNDL